MIQIAALLLSLALLAPLTAAPAGNPTAGEAQPSIPKSQEQEPRVEVDRLAEGVFLYTYNVHRSLFVVTDDGVLATDPQSPEAARRYVEEIRKITSAPVRYVVYSHHHGDHVSGGTAFGEDAVVIGQRNVRHHVMPGSEIVPPDLVFDDDASIILGDLEVRLLYPGPSETDSNIIVHVPERRVAFMVDAVSVRALPWRNMSSGHPIAWIEALEYLDTLDFDILAPGHGPTGTKADVAENIAYMTALVEAVRERIAQGQTLEEIQETLTLPEFADWTRYDEHLKLNIEGVYRELTQ